MYYEWGQRSHQLHALTQVTHKAQVGKAQVAMVERQHPEHARVLPVRQHQFGHVTPYNQKGNLN